MATTTCTHPSYAQHVDHTRGTIACTLCGQVISTQQFELDTIVRGDKPPPMRTAGFARPGRAAMSQPLQTTHHRPSIEAARRALTALARPLEIPAEYVESAAAIYKMAVNVNAVIGAKTCVLCACLYIVCRRNGSSLMVLDFADASGDAPQQILHYVKVICEATFTMVPPLDPSYFILRFAKELNLGEHLNEVALCALKILRTMKDDWIHTGRRPLGPCAAAILVACQTFGIARSVDDVLPLARLTEGTIAKRLSEFASTAAGSLASIDDYICQDDKSNPMAFLHGRMKEAEYKYTNEVLEITALYWELVDEAKKQKSATEQRNEKWKRFWELKANFQKGVKGAAGEESIPLETAKELSAIPFEAQLNLLGLRKEKVVAIQQLQLSEEEQTAEYQRLNARLGGGGENQHEGAFQQQNQQEQLHIPDLTREIILLPSDDDDDDSGSDGNHQEDQLEVVGKKGQKKKKKKKNRPEEEEKEKGAVEKEKPTTTSIIDEYIIKDIDTRLRLQQMNEDIFKELWKRGGPRDKAVPDPEQLLNLEAEGEGVAGQNTTQGRAVKRKRSQITASRTPAEAIAKGLKGKGAGQINLENIDHLLPNATRGIGSAGGTDVAESLDDEWPVD